MESKHKVSRPLWRTVSIVAMLIVVMALVLSGCRRSAPQEPAGAAPAQEAAVTEPAAAQAESEPTEAAEDEAPAEAAEADETAAGVVEESQAAQSAELRGVEVVSDEE